MQCNRAPGNGRALCSPRPLSGPPARRCKPLPVRLLVRRAAEEKGDAQTVRDFNEADGKVSTPGKGGNFYNDERPVRGRLGFDGRQGRLRPALAPWDAMRVRDTARLCRLRAADTSRLPVFECTASSGDAPHRPPRMLTLGLRGAQLPPKDTMSPVRALTPG
jgi:hypothetical protein